MRLRVASYVAAEVRWPGHRGGVVPRSWTGDRDRCGQAGIGGDVTFATRPQLAKAMIGRVRELGLPFSWFTADEACGDNGKLREWLEEQKISYVVAVACDTLVPAGAGKKIRAGKLAAKVPRRGWQVMSCARARKATGCMTGRCLRPGTADGESSGVTVRSFVKQF